jgi:hypothetical protein
MREPDVYPKRKRVYSAEEAVMEDRAAAASASEGRVVERNDWRKLKLCLNSAVAPVDAVVAGA